MQHLTRDNLDQLTLRWELWETEAATPVRRVGRARLHLLFLLIRYGALRLGEALELDARRTVNTATGMVAVPGPNGRSVLLPLTCMRHVRRILSLPEAESMGADFLRFDQGFIRKKFYAVAEPLGLDPNRVGPRALRYARGLELLELHVPLGVVQKFLGQQKPAQIAAFLDFSGGEARRIVRAHALGRAGAPVDDGRNSLIGIVSAVETGMRMARVHVTTFADYRLTALCPLKQFLRLELRAGQVVTALIDSEHLALAVEPVSTSLANSLAGVVRSFHRDAVEAFVEVELPDGTRLSATPETAVVDGLRLAEGKKVYALFPSRAVRLCLD